MIAIPFRRSHDGRPRRRLLGVLAAVAVSWGGGCAGPRWNSVREAKADDELAAEEARLAEHERQLRRLRLEVGERREEITRLEGERAAAVAEQNERAAELDDALTTLQAIEQDVAAAAARRAALEEQRASLEALRREVAGAEAEQAALAARQQELRSERDALAAKVAETERVLGAELAGLRDRLERLDAVRKAALEAGIPLADPAPADPPPADPPPADPDKREGGGR